MSEEFYEFEWSCPKRGQQGTCIDDHGFWKFCPYCGSELKIKEVTYEEN